MTAEEVLEMIKSKRAEIAFYNGESEFAVKVLDGLIKEIKEKL